MAHILNNYDDLVQFLSKHGKKIITLDGRDGSGKTYLSKQLHQALGGTLLSEKTYRSASLDELFEFDKNKLLRDLARGLQQKPVLFESCFMLEILNQIGLKPDVTVYIKTLSEATGRWTDEDEVAEEVTKAVALQKEIDFGKSINIPPSNFRLQMIAYHYDHKPHEKSDVIYERIEKYSEAQ